MGILHEIYQLQPKAIAETAILVVRKDNSVESKKIKDARSKKIKIMNLNDFTKYITCL